MSDTVRLRREGAVATVTLNRPDLLNAISLEMSKALLQAVRSVNESGQVKVAILTGEGRGFCSGADLAGVAQEAGGMTPFTIPDYLKTLHQIMLGIFHSDKIWISAVNGPAVGAGCNLALVSDFVLASEEAYFYEIFTRRGLAVDMGGSFLLVHLVGLRKAMELALLPEKIPAAQAKEIGLINEVHPGEKLADEAALLGERLAAGPTRAFAGIKATMHKAITSSFEDSLDFETYVQGIIVQSEDGKEGVVAFLEKREPKFKGA